MATTADFKNGLCIELNGELWSIVEFQHVKPGKGPAFVRTKLRNLRTQRVWENTFTAGVKPGELINNPGLLKEGQGVEIMYHADTDTPLTCELPPFVDLQVTYTEPGVKGDTATNAAKRATVETGAEVFVPLFIETGEMIKVDTRTNKYAERVK